MGGGIERKAETETDVDREGQETDGQTERESGEERSRDRQTDRDRLMLTEKDIRQTDREEEWRGEI